MCEGVKDAKLAETIPKSVHLLDTFSSTFPIRGALFREKKKMCALYICGGGLLTDAWCGAPL